MKGQKRYLPVLAAVFMILTVLTACAGEASQGPVLVTDETGERIDTGFVATGPDSYDSADTAIIVDRNPKDNTITFLNLVLGRRYTLSMDGTTHFYDRYGESISSSQIAKGDIVDVTFLKSGKHLTSLQLSPKAWSYEAVEHYDIDFIRGEVTIGTEVYRTSQNTQYLSAGRSIDQMDLNTSDTLTFQGIDSEILCVTVEKGHGYLRLVNDENFVGGWIEIGQSHVQQITQDMLLVVPEGSYQVNISHRGGGGTKHVVINRNEETTLDIGDLAVAEAQYGTILFSLTPSGASLYVDGAKQDASQPVTLEYGIHQLIVKAEGYQTVTRYLRVGQASAGVDITLEPSEEAGQESEQTTSDTKTASTETDTADNTAGTSTDTAAGGAPDSSGGQSSGGQSTKTDSPGGQTAEGEDASTDSSAATEALTDYYKVYVDAPEGVEVYLDGNYVGIAPCSWRKQSGMHVITLRKTGYETRSYTVQVDDEAKDMSYSFVDLIENSTAQ